jgi:phage-related protein
MRQKTVTVERQVSVVPICRQATIKSRSSALVQPVSSRLTCQSRTRRIAPAVRANPPRYRPALLRCATAPYEIEFYEDSAGCKPCLEWIKELDTRNRRALGTAMREILQHQGINVCSSPFGKQLGEGLFEFRLRDDGLLLRVFCHAYGNKIVLLLSGYDKGESPGERRQQREIGVARKRLKAWQQRQRY